MTSCIGTTRAEGDNDGDNDNSSTDGKGEPIRGSMALGVVASSMNWNISINASSADWKRACENAYVKVE